MRKILELYMIYLSTLMTWADSAAVRTYFVPEAILNQLAIKLLVSGLLTGHIGYVYLFLHHNIFYSYISLVPCKSFDILTSY